jgi:hypothetical protein
MYENSYGVPDTLPSGYGGDLAAAPAVRLNSGTLTGPAALARQRQGGPRPAPMPPPGFHQMQQVPGVVRLSDVEHEFDEPQGAVWEYGYNEFDNECDYAYEYHEGYGGFGADDEGPPIRRDKKLKLNYRVLDTRDKDGYMYRQYSNGLYAITAGKVPSGVTLNVPFGPEQNPNAFAAIQTTVVAAIGQFPAGAKPSKPSKKKGKRKDKKDKKKGKKVDVGKLAQTGLEVAGKVAKKFEASGKDAKPTDEEEGPTPDGGGGEGGESGMPWYSQRVFGLPMWGVIVGGVAIAGGLYLALKKPSVPVAPPPPMAPPVPAPRRVTAKTAAALPSSPAPAVEDED